MALARQTLFIFIFVFIFISSLMIDVGRVDGARSAPYQGAKQKSRYLGEKPGGAGGQADVAKKVSEQMQGIEKRVGEFSATLKQRMEHPESSPGTQDCNAECDEVLGAAVDDIHKALDSLSGQNLSKANFDISAVSTNVDTCNDCFNEMAGGDPDIKQLNEYVGKVTEEALTALQKATTA